MSEVAPGPLATFDPFSAELYASVSSDNRLRIWNVATGQLRQQYVEPKHLSKRYTCIAWHRREGKGKRSSSGAAKRPTMGLIALGTVKGSISLWDLKRGAVVHSLGEGAGLPQVTSVAFSLDGKSLYSASSDKEVVEWNLETGEMARKLKGLKHGATKLCLHPLGKILAIASSSIRLLELSSGKRARKLSAGHAGSVNQLEFSADGRYLVSSAASSRFANVFDVAGEDAPSEPVATLGFAAAPAFLALHSSPPGDDNKGDDQLTVVGGTDDGGVSVLRTRRQGDGKTGPVSKLKVRGSPEKASPSIQRACLSSERPSSAIVVATGSPTSLSFTEVSFEDSAGALLASVSLDEGSQHEADEGTAPAKSSVKKSAPAHVVGPGELGIRGVEVDALDEVNGKPGGVAGGVDSDGRRLKRLKAAGDESDIVAEGVEEGASVAPPNGTEGALTIAERLEALSEVLDEEEAARNKAGAAGTSTAPFPGGGVGGDGAQPRAESLATVLTQALHSGDEALLEQCLAVNDQGMIEATIERLSSSKVLPFLLRVVSKLEKSPSRAATLGRWIRALLSCHLGYLVSVPGLSRKLALLHQLVDRRVASFPKLLQLQGRLDLLLKRARSGEAIAAANTGGLLAANRVMDHPEAVYREEDEDEDDDGEEDDDEDSGDEEDEGEDGDEDGDGEGDEDGDGDEEQGEDASDDNGDDGDDGGQGNGDGDETEDD